MRIREKLVAAGLLAVALIGCSSAASKVFIQPPPVSGREATTPELLTFLISQEAAYRIERARLVEGLTSARRNAGDATTETSARIGAGLAANSIRKDLEGLDHAWRALLTDMLAHAPTVDDFYARATVFRLTSEELAIYEQLFLAVQRSPSR